MNRGDVLRLVTVRKSARDGRARALREAAGLTQAEVAAVCGVRAATVCRWEAGARTPRGEAALRYARLLEALEAGL